MWPANAHSIHLRLTSRACPSRFQHGVSRYPFLEKMNKCAYTYNANIDGSSDFLDNMFSQACVPRDYWHKHMSLVCIWKSRKWMSEWALPQLTLTWRMLYFPHGFHLRYSPLMYEQVLNTKRIILNPWPNEGAGKYIHCHIHDQYAVSNMVAIIRVSASLVLSKSDRVLVLCTTKIRLIANTTNTATYVLDRGWY